MKKTIKPKFAMRENITFELRDSNGNIKKVFQPYKWVAFLVKHGVISTDIRRSILTGYNTKKLTYANLVVNAGKAGVASRINGAGSEAVFGYIAIGTGTTAAAVGQTALVTEITTGGGARALGSASRTTTTVTNDTARSQVTFTFSASFAVTEVALLNAASAGTMLNRSVFTAINVASGDTLQVTVDISVA